MILKLSHLLPGLSCSPMGCLSHPSVEIKLVRVEVTPLFPPLVQWRLAPTQWLLKDYVKIKLSEVAVQGKFFKISQGSAAVKILCHLVKPRRRLREGR